MLVEDLIKKLVNEYPDYLFVSPIHSFSFLYNSVDYTTGLNMCLWLLKQCDEMWVFGDYQESVGCMSEIAYCQNHSIPYKIIESECPWQHIHFDPQSDYVYKKIKTISKKCDMCCECGLVDYDEYNIICRQKEMKKLYKECRDTVMLQKYGNENQN